MPERSDDSLKLQHTAVSRSLGLEEATGPLLKAGDCSVLSATAGHRLTERPHVDVAAGGQPCLSYTWRN